MGGGPELQLQPGRLGGLAPVLKALAATIGLAWLGLVAVAGFTGSQDGSSNPANYLTWLYFWPGAAILVAVVGDVSRYFNPWGRLGSLLVRASQAGRRPGYVWPAVVAFAAFAWFDLASGLSNRPRDLAIAVVVFSALVLLPVPLAGAGWIATAEPFGLVLGAIGRMSLRAALRRVGWPADGPAGGWDHFVLLLLPLAAGLFDALIATPQWTSLAGSVAGGAGLERGGPVFAAIRTAGLGITCLTVATVMLGAAAAVGSRRRLAATARLVAQVTLPVAVAIMAAHNLPALLQLGPRLPGVLGGFVTGRASAPSTSPETAVFVTSSSPIWTIEVAIMVLGLLWSAWFAWRDMERPSASGFDKVAAAYPAWAFLAATTAAAFVILYQPVSALTGR